MARSFVAVMVLGAVLVALVGLPDVAHGQAEPVITMDDSEDDMPALDDEGSGIEIPDLSDTNEFRDWLLELTPKERDSVFMAAEAGPKPKGLYIGFMLSDRPNFEDFEVSLTDKAVMTFVFDRWIGKVFDGKGNLRNVLNDESGFTDDDLKGTIELGKGYVDKDESWIAEYPEEAAYGFILDEFREIKPGFLFGKTFLVPAKKGDKVFFECGLVRIQKKVPKEEKANELILDASAEVEPVAEGEAVAGNEEDEVEAEAEVEAEEKDEKSSKKNKSEKESESEEANEDEDVESEEANEDEEVESEEAVESEEDAPLVKAQANGDDDDDDDDGGDGEEGAGGSDMDMPAPEAEAAEPESVTPEGEAAMPDTEAAAPDTEAAMPDMEAAMPDTEAAAPDTELNDMMD